VQVEDLALLEALRGLSIGQRQVLVLHYLVGMPVQEVARTLGVPSGTVKVRLARGRSALAAQLGGQQKEVRPRHD
jgi:RNA polymerase sigma factor (sigma-70 family)